MNRLELDDPLFTNKRAIKEAIKIIQVSSGKNITRKKDCILEDDKLGRKVGEYLFNSISRNVNIIFNTEVEVIKKDDVFIVDCDNNKRFKANKCLIATGKNTYNWVKKTCEYFNIKTKSPNIKIGIRVEVPTFKVFGLIEKDGDIKIECDDDVCTDDTRVDSFVGEWEDSKIISTFGYGMPNKRSDKTNFVISYTAKEENLREAKIVNILNNDKIKPEIVKEYMSGNSVLEYLNTFSKFKKSFVFLNKILPSFINYSIMYSPDVELSGILPVTKSMNTSVDGLYGAGECTTIVSTTIGAMASGIVATKTILKE
jgi:uncharacterized FAD-dependent dehydrogenase